VVQRRRRWRSWVMPGSVKMTTVPDEATAALAWPDVRGHRRPGSLSRAGRALGGLASVAIGIAERVEKPGYRDAMVVLGCGRP
jgi:hypothetical protein